MTENLSNPLAVAKKAAKAPDRCHPSNAETIDFKGLSSAMSRKPAQKPFIKLGEYVVNLDGISYISFQEYNNQVTEAVIYLRVTEGSTANEGWLAPDKLKFRDREAQLIHRFFVNESQTHVLF